MLSWVKLTLPGQSVSGGVGAGIFNQIFVIIPTISLVLLPATLLCLRSGIGSWKRSHVIVGVELGAIVVAFHLLRWFSEPGAFPTVLLDNLITQFGVPGPHYLIGGRPVVLADTLWILLNVLALVATLALFGVVAGLVGGHVRAFRGLRSMAMSAATPTGILAIFCAAVAVGLTVYATRFPIYDRYVWPVVPAAATLLLAVRSAAGPGVG